MGESGEQSVPEAVLHPEVTSSSPETTHPQESEKERGFLGRVFTRVKDRFHSPDHPIMQDPQSTESGKKISRRNFLKGAAATAAYIGLTGDIPVKQEREHAFEQEMRSNLLTAQEQLGFDISAIAERTGFVPEVTILSESGQYIVHIEQTHSAQYSTKANIRDNAASQRSNEMLLLELQKANPEMNNVFSEGFTKEAVETWIPELRSRFQAMQNLPIEKQSYEQLQSLYTSLQFPESSGVSPQQIQDYAYLNKFRELEEALGDETASDPLIETYRTFANAIDTKLSDHSENAMYILGAGLKLDLEGKMSLRPTESEKELKEASSIAEKSSGFIEVTDEVEKELFTDRENAILENIRSDETVKNQKIVPLLFGGAHDFTPELLSANSAQEEKCGLIVLSPKQQSTQ